MEESIFDPYDYGHFDHYDDHYHSLVVMITMVFTTIISMIILIMLMVDLNDKRPPGEQKMQPHLSGFLRGRGPF